MCWIGALTQLSGGSLANGTHLIWGQLLAWRSFSEDIHFKFEYKLQIVETIFAILSSDPSISYSMILQAKLWDDDAFLIFEKLLHEYIYI